MFRGHCQADRSLGPRRPGVRVCPPSCYRRAPEGASSRGRPLPLVAERGLGRPGARVTQAGGDPDVLPGRRTSRSSWRLTLSANIRPGGRRQPGPAGAGSRAHTLAPHQPLGVSRLARGWGHKPVGGVGLPSCQGPQEAGGDRSHGQGPGGGCLKSRFCPRGAGGPQPPQHLPRRGWQPWQCPRCPQGGATGRPLRSNNGETRNLGAVPTSCVRTSWLSLDHRPSGGPCPEGGHPTGAHPDQKPVGTAWGVA